MRKGLIFLIVALASLYALHHAGGLKAVRRIDIPKGQLVWSSERPARARFCVPAAFSDSSGKIVGQYKTDGNTVQGQTYRMRVSLKGDSFVIDGTWHSDNGFQQFALVNNSKVMRFGRDRRRFCRRALCKKDGRTFILQSWFPLTLDEFAEECGKRSTEAVNLDMGSYAYGYVMRGPVKVPLALWAYFGRDKQTNWLYVGY